MNHQNITGLFGKLPAHGDFIHRNLPSGFINIWDEWLQHYITSSQQQLGTEWLDIYLTSPIWRFALSPGVIDNHAWAGIMLPSVDRVGRYFPFSIVTRIAKQINPLEFMTSQMAWFRYIEDLSIQALDGELQADDLMQNILDNFVEQAPGYRQAGSEQGMLNAHIELEFEEQSPASAFAYLLDASLMSSLSSYSAWSTQGSDRVQACMFTSKGLPPLNGITAMLDGDWANRNWKQPYTLNAV